MCASAKEKALCQQVDLISNQGKSRNIISRVVGVVANANLGRSEGSEGWMGRGGGGGGGGWGGGLTKIELLWIEGEVSNFENFFCRQRLCKTL